MQFILTIMLTAASGFSLLQCQKATTAGKPEAAKTNSATTTATTATSNTTANAAPPTATEEAPRISLADAKKDFDAGNVVFVDTRGASSYKNEHIKGAVNIPAENFPARYAEIPKGKKIIAYCS